MDREDFTAVIYDVINEVANMKYTETTLPKLGTISTDINDIGNAIGIAVGKHIAEKGLDKNEFVGGIMHGISLKDGTHG